MLQTRVGLTLDNCKKFIKPLWLTNNNKPPLWTNMALTASSSSFIVVKIYTQLLIRQNKATTIIKPTQTATGINHNKYTRRGPCLGLAKFLKSISWDSPFKMSTLCRLQSPRYPSENKYVGGPEKQWVGYRYTVVSYLFSRVRRSAGLRQAQVWFPLGRPPPPAGPSTKKIICLDAGAI
jgi:hypothetical protein